MQSSYRRRTHDTQNIARQVSDYAANLHPRSDEDLLAMHLEGLARYGNAMPHPPKQGPIPEDLLKISAALYLLQIRHPNRIDKILRYGLHAPSYKLTNGSK